MGWRGWLKSSILVMLSLRCLSDRHPSGDIKQNLQLKLRAGNVNLGIISMLFKNMELGAPG